MSLGGSGLEASLGRDQVDRRQLLFRSAASCGTGAPDALDCGAEKGERQGAP